MYFVIYRISYLGRDSTFIFVLSWRIWDVVSYWCRWCHAYKYDAQSQNKIHIPSSKEYISWFSQVLSFTLLIFVFVFSWRTLVVVSYWCHCATSPPPAGSLSWFSRPETFPRWTSPASQVRHGTSQGSYNRPLRYHKKLLMGVITGLTGTTRNFSGEL